jgi:hypothetical protein
MQTSLAFWIQSSNGVILRDCIYSVAKAWPQSSTSLLEQLRTYLEGTAERAGEAVRLLMNNLKRVLATINFLPFRRNADQMNLITARRPQLSR